MNIRSLLLILTAILLPLPVLRLLHAAGPRRVVHPTAQVVAARAAAAHARSVAEQEELLRYYAHQREAKIRSSQAQAAAKRRHEEAQLAKIQQENGTSMAQQRALLEQFNKQRDVAKARKKIRPAAVKLAQKSVTWPRTSRPIPAPQPAHPRLVWETSPPQSGAECGYYAAWNGFAMYQRFLGRNRPAFPLNQLKRQIQHGRTATLEHTRQQIRRGNENLQAAIRARRPQVVIDELQIAQNRRTQFAAERTTDADWLDDREVNLVARQLGALATAYTVIPNIHTFNALHNQDMVPTLRNLRTINGFMHIFLVGNMQQNNDHHTSLGHWIAVVARRENNQIRFYARDSLGRSQESVDALMQLVEHRDLRHFGG